MKHFNHPFLSVYLKKGQRYLRSILMVLGVVSVLAPSAFVWANISTISSDSKTYTFLQDGTPFETQFSSDGTKMYMLGYDNDTVYQYTLSTPWDVSTATYDNVSFSVNAQESVPEGMVFKSDGSAMYIIGVAGDRTYQYTLSTPWDLSTAAYAEKSSPSNSARDNTTVKVQFNDDGTKMYHTGFINGNVYQYTLSTPWDVSTATYDNVSFSTAAQTTNPYATAFNSNGTKLYAVGPNDVIHQYTLSTGWDLSTASYDTISFNANGVDSNLYGITLKTDDTKIYFTGATNNRIYQYSIDLGDLVAPSISTLSPADNATGVGLTDNLIITFGESVDVETGDITLYRASDDTVIEAIDVTSGQVTGSGSDTITVNPTNALTAGVAYYVQIDATAFDDVASNSFAGISDETTWNFTALSQSGSSTANIPIVENISISTSSIAPSCDGMGGAVLSLSALNASGYLIGNDALFVNSKWFEFTESPLLIEWELSGAQGEVEVYVLFRNAVGTLSDIQTLTVDLGSVRCDQKEEDADDEQVLLEDAAGEEEEGSRIGPSPWDGSIEVISSTEEGMLIRGKNYDTVYLLEDGKRRPFIKEAIYYTWYENFDDIRTVTNATLQTIPMGAPMLPKSGSLVKIQSVPDVYEVEDVDLSAPTLRHIPSEAEANDAFGNDWAKRVIDLDVFLFVRFLLADSI